LTDQIDKANVTVTVNPYHVTYDASTHTATRAIASYFFAKPRRIRSSVLVERQAR